MKSNWVKIFIVIFSLWGVPAYAQGTLSPEIVFYIISGLAIIVAILVLVVAIIVLQILRLFLKKQAEASGIVTEAKPSQSWWQKFLTKANDAVPIDREQEIILDHNYDGIRELDNHLPPWWKWLFYITIIFAVVYMVAYHVVDTLPLQTEEYEAEMALAEEDRLARLADQPQKSIDESNVVFDGSEEALASGRQVFNLNCAACHKEDGGGGIGPNLVDSYWLHGGSVQDIFRTVKVGVPDKGMIAWKDMLSPEQMQNVSSYIISLQGTTPANPKAPQGELYVEEAPTELDTLSETKDTSQIVLMQ